METVVGCDVGKTQIDVAILGSVLRRCQLRNEQRAIEALARELPKGSQVGMEATGTLHELLADTLVAAGHCVYVINPRWIRAYARGLGMRGKTDRTDCMVIARYVSAEHQHLHAYRPPAPEQRELRRLLQRRLALARLAAATRLSLGEEAAPIVAQFDQLLKQLERRINELIKANREWTVLAQRLRKIPGIGALTAAQLVATLTRLPFHSADAFIAHTGTDPRPNDSGQKHGRRRLSHHGNAALRSLLFMAAMSASRNPHWRPYYEAQRAKGLSSTAAFIIIARKLGRIAFSLFKSQQEYEPARMACLASS